MWLFFQIEMHEAKDLHNYSLFTSRKSTKKIQFSRLRECVHEDINMTVAVTAYAQITSLKKKEEKGGVVVFRICDSMKHHLRQRHSGS